MSRPRQPFYDKLLEQLRDPEISEILSKKEGTRMLDDLPEKFGDRFDWMFVNYQSDLSTLVRILQPITSVRQDNQLGVSFIYGRDANAVRQWAKVILRHACRELLDSANEVDSKILALIHKKSEPTLARNFIYAYFATYSAQILSAIAENVEEYEITPDAFTAMTLLLKECSDWIEQIWPVQGPSMGSQKKWPCVSAANSSGILFFGNLADSEAATREFQVGINDNNNRFNKF